MIPLAIGLGLAAAGAVASFIGSSKSSSAQEASIDAQQRAEAIRFKAMKLDADRRRREMIRQGMIARSQALATGTAQGMSSGSAQHGAFGQVAGFTNWNISGINQNEQIGTELFAANRELLSARRQEASAATISSFGAGLSSLGGAVLGNIGAINRVTNNLQSPNQPYNITSPYNNLGASNAPLTGLNQGVRGLY